MIRIDNNCVIVHVVQSYTDCLKSKQTYAIVFI